MATYWLVDIGAGAVEVWHPDDEEPVVVGDRLTWTAPGATGPCTLDLTEVFRDLPS